jgi:hypothetical protein
MIQVRAHEAQRLALFHGQIIAADELRAALAAFALLAHLLEHHEFRRFVQSFL